MTRGALVFLFSSVAFGAGNAPTAETLKQVLDKQLHKLQPSGMTERNVLFQEVRTGTPNAGFYPFQVTLTIRDYGPGYPANKFYGETCVSKLEKETFQLSRDSFGDWQVQGRMTPSNRECKRNPAAGVSSIPLNTLQGSAAAGGPIAKPGPAAPPTGLPTGEWACYGTGGRVLFGFTLQPGGSYLDGDRKKAGSYSYSAAAGTVTFRGGPMDGQTGTNAKGRSFQLSRTVSCEAMLH